MLPRVGQVLLTREDPGGGLMVWTLQRKRGRLPRKGEQNEASPGGLFETPGFLRPGAQSLHNPLQQRLARSEALHGHVAAVPGGQVFFRGSASARTRLP